MQGTVGRKVGQLTHGFEIDLPFRGNGSGAHLQRLARLGRVGLRCGHNGAGDGRRVTAGAGAIGACDTLAAGADDGAESPRNRAKRFDIYSSIDTSESAFVSAGVRRRGDGRSKCQRTVLRPVRPPRSRA